MYGQASPRWPISTTLVLLVAFFGVYLNSDLYLASPVTDDSLGDSNNLAEHAKTEHPEHENSTGSINEVSKCMKGQEVKKARDDCAKKAVEHDFAEVKDNQCKADFAVINCDALIMCKDCNKGGTDLLLQLDAHRLDEMAKGSCKEWESMAPKVPSTCQGGGQRSGDASDKPSYLIYIIVVVVLVVAVVIAVVVYCLMCAGDSKGHSAKPGKSSKGSKSMKAGKSTKSGIKGGKSTKSSKSAKSGKSLKGGKSTKSKKSTKSSKGGKSAKK